MINNFEIKNFGPIKQIQCKQLGKINLIIGDNGTGKTILLKALYTGIKTLEEYKRGKEPRTEAEILIDKLYWTFELDKVGDLVRKGANELLRFDFTFDDRDFSYEFGKDTTKSIHYLKNQVSPRQSNSIFLPPKEVLSLHKIILKSREQDKEFGFDETYLDLVKALMQSTQKGKNYKVFAQSRNNLSELLQGKIEYNDKLNIWQFKKGNQKFSIGLTSEGIKKISILDILLGNRYLDQNSIIFIDEPEAALHPTAISGLLDIIAMLAECGIQFFLTTHSYFVIKKLSLIAQEKKDLPILVISEESENWNQTNIKDGLPDNSIINESIRLYKEHMRLVLDE
jgi:AAA15 family ATPase/GTPase